MSETETLTAARVPTVYFIDDSATMREVIKIAFRKENIHVVTCADAATAIAQFDATAPDAVITDVIMPDKDGYEVCQFIKQHEQLSRTPVILMSGVVNRAVAEKAMAVNADELIRKPFQPQDLIARVKNLLNPEIGGRQRDRSVCNESSDAPRRPRRLCQGCFPLALRLRASLAASLPGARLSQRAAEADKPRGTAAARSSGRAACTAAVAPAAAPAGPRIGRSSKATQRNAPPRVSCQEIASGTRSRAQILRSSRVPFQDSYRNPNRCRLPRRDYPACSATLRCSFETWSLRWRLTRVGTRSNLNSPL